MANNLELILDLLFASRLSLDSVEPTKKTAVDLRRAKDLMDILLREVSRQIKKQQEASIQPETNRSRSLEEESNG